jgi:hypothetical protein
MQQARRILLSLPLLLFPSLSAFAHPGHAADVCQASRVVLAGADLLPVAVVLGAGVLTWLLGNRRPRLQPAPHRKPAPSRPSKPARGR